MTRARVAMVLNTLGLGGVPEVAYQLIRHLPRDRFECSLFVLKANTSQTEVRSERLHSVSGADVEVAFATGEGGKIGAIADLADWLNTKSIDILHTHSYRPNLYGRMAGAMLRPNGLRIVAHYHNQYDDKWDANPTSLKLETRLASTSDAMIAVSQSVRSHVSEKLGVDAGQIDVVQNGVDAARFQGEAASTLRSDLDIDPSAFVVGLVGRVCEQKGHEDAVEASILLREQLPGAVFFMAGDIEDKALHSRLIERIAVAGLSQGVRFLGHVSNVPSLYAALDLVIVPSRWEGFGLTLVEAMAAKVPIAACDVGAIREVAEDAATLIPDRDPRALADAIATLANSPDCRAALVRAGARRCGAFSWESSALKVAEIYERALRPEPFASP